MSADSVQKSIGQSTSSSQLTSGGGSFQFRDNSSNSIKVWFFRPQTLKKDSPIVFVIHGVNRDAERYCRGWTPYAQKYNFLLVCPQFDAEHFPTRAYQHGNLFDESGRPMSEAYWTFTTIENLFDYVKRVTGNPSDSYYIYGHSAGAQFVHRFVLFMPNARYKRAVAANPGFYTMPTYSAHKFPYGLRDSGLRKESLRKSFGRDFVLMLGTEDTDAQDPELNQHRNAEEQGATRFDRGQNFFRTARAEAAELGAQLRWQLQTVPGAHHSDREMIPAAAATLLAK